MAMPELEFAAEVARRSGSGFCSTSTICTERGNHGFDPHAALAALPARCVKEIHLAGHARTELCLIDDHGSPVTDPVWWLYEAALARLGRVRTLIEWDTRIPDLDVLLGEARKAETLLDAVHA